MNDMRLSTAMMSQQGLQSLQRQQSNIFQAQQDINTGIKLRTAETDPAGFARAVELQNLSDKTDQYLRNNKMAEGKIERQEGMMGEAIDIMQRVREIGIRANASLEGQDQTGGPVRQALIDELDELKQMLSGMANAKDERGEFIFSGTQPGEKPFDDAGALNLDLGGDVSLSISENQKVTINRSAEDVFTADGDSAMQIIDQLQGLIENDGSVEDFSENQGKLDAVMRNLNLTQGEMGNQLKTLERSFEDQSAQQLVNAGTLSDLRDTDLAEAITRLNDNIMGLQATQQTISRTMNLSLFNVLN